jgi:hypothetical protein
MLIKATPDQASLLSSQCVCSDWLNYASADNVPLANAGQKLRIAAVYLTDLIMRGEGWGIFPGASASCSGAMGAMAQSFWPKAVEPNVTFIL